MTTKILAQANHKHVAAVHLCSTGSMTKDGEPVGKVLKFTSNSKLMVGRLAMQGLWTVSLHSETCWFD